MSTRRSSFDAGPGRTQIAAPATALLLGGCVCFIAAGLHLSAQQPLLPAFEMSSSSPKQTKHKAPDKPAVEPNIVVPVAPLGFAPPAAWYLGQRVSQVSLSFLDEENLLFTFRVPGLIARDKTRSENPAPDERDRTSRHIRALVLELPSGKVVAEDVWELHDAARYLWPLKDRKFLLRDKNQIQIGDASLHLEPFLRFPGWVSLLELPPDQHLLVTNTTEPPAPEPQSESGSDSSDTPSTASASISISGHPASDSGPTSSSTQDLLRILRMDNRTVMLFSRVAGTTHVPIDGEGYYEALRGKASNWLINYQEFHGGSTPIASLDSTCSPGLDVPAPGIVLASACTDGGGRRVLALSRAAISLPAKPESKKEKPKDKDKPRNKPSDKAETTHLLWDMPVSPTNVWPQLASSFNGHRVARATLSITRPIGISSPLDREDIRGQSVQIYDLATGNVPLTVPASPVFDAGGNFALSPSGKRFAVLNAGAIQIYNLPPAPDLPPPALRP